MLAYYSFYDGHLFLLCSTQTETFKMSCLSLEGLVPLWKLAYLPEDVSSLIDLRKIRILSII